MTVCRSFARCSFAEDEDLRAVEQLLRAMELPRVAEVSRCLEEGNAARRVLDHALPVVLLRRSFGLLETDRQIGLASLSPIGQRNKLSLVGVRVRVMVRFRD